MKTQTNENSAKLTINLIFGLVISAFAFVVIYSVIDAIINL